MKKFELPEYLENADLSEVNAFIIEHFESNPYPQRVLIEEHPICLERIDQYEQEDDMRHLHNDLSYRAMGLEGSELFFSKNEGYAERLYLTGTYTIDVFGTIYLQGELTHSLACHNETGARFERILYDDCRFAA